MSWLEEFRSETQAVITDPFLCCLAEAIAAVESRHGGRAIREGKGLNEIGYKAVPGRPSIAVQTREADSVGQLKPAQAAFRLFRDREEQARALLWLLRSSRFYEASRLLFILAFYAAYAPGRLAGARALVKVFNELAASGAHEGVKPFALVDPQAAQADGELLRLNHTAARQAVRLFAELTKAPALDVVPSS